MAGIEHATEVRAAPVEPRVKARADRSQDGFDAPDRHLSREPAFNARHRTAAHVRGGGDGGLGQPGSQADRAHLATKVDPVHGPMMRSPTYRGVTLH